MKVLHYVDENRLSWAVPWLQLLKALGGLGIENVIACRPGGTLRPLAENAGFRVRTTLPRFAWAPCLCRSFGKILEEEKPDLLHSRLSSAAFIGGYWGKKAGVPVIATIDKYPKAKYYRNAAALFACSRAVALHMRGQGFPDNRIHLVYNPVEISRYRRDELVRQKFREEQGIPPGSRVILGAGRFVDWKGFDLLVEAFSAIGDPDSLLWIVGEGPEEGTIRRAIERKRIGGKVSVFPFASDIRPYLWAADLFAQPSWQPEGFSLMLLEAMASGLPAVATGIGGTTDILEDGVAGWVIAPRELRPLERALREATGRDPAGLEAMGHRASEKAEGFSLEAVAGLTHALYRQLTGASGEEKA